LPFLQKYKKFKFFKSCSKTIIFLPHYIAVGDSTEKFKALKNAFLDPLHKQTLLTVKVTIIEKREI
jgi:hypothetical protein